jgi:hypothetical protein
LTRDYALIGRERGKYPGKCLGSPPALSSIGSGGEFFPVSSPAPGIRYGSGARLGKPTPRLGKPASCLGKSASGLGKSALRLGKPVSGLGKSVPCLGKPASGLGKSVPRLGKPASNLGNSDKPLACLTKSLTCPGVYAKKTTLELNKEM